MEHCPEHEKTMELLHKIDKTTSELSVRVNGSITDIEKHIQSGQAWRISIASIAAGWIISIITVAFVLGGMNNQITVNTERWNRLLERNPVIINTDGLYETKSR
jgi:hypothetical protein